MRKLINFILICLLASLIIYAIDAYGSQFKQVSLESRVKLLERKVNLLEDYVKALQNNPRWEYIDNKLKVIK